MDETLELREFLHDLEKLRDKLNVINLSISASVNEDGTKTIVITF